MGVTIQCKKTGDSITCAEYPVHKRSDGRG